MSLDENPLLKYAKYSLYDYCNDLITTIAERPIILTSHYRSNYDIIEYSNQMFYQRKLQRRLEVLTQERHPELRELGIKWIDVIGKQLRDDRNINQDEVEKCFDIAQELLNQYPNISIGIISPFKHQVEALKERFRNIDEDQLRIDTVHKFQGDECDVIIYSIVVTDNSPDGKIWWIDQGEPNLVNVAITRARSLVYVVGNKEYVRTHSNNNLPLGYLLTYTEQL
jgi:superfamily I DNA and/or RNA helicase